MSCFDGKFDPKNHICLFKMKFGTKTNLNMLNSMGTFICPVLDVKYPFFVNLVQKIKIVCLS